MFNAQRRIVLHIGWPKTGTTTLQKHVFPALPGFRYLGKTPFDAARNKLTFDLVYLLAYASDERSIPGQAELFQTLVDTETGIFGDVDPSVPLIISEEGVLSSLLKPSDHQHHGHSTASLRQVAARLARLGTAWNATFDVLITERDPVEILHAYYAQLFHIFRRIDGLGTFKAYVEAGTGDRFGRDLGFRYLKPGVVNRAFMEQLGEGRVYTTHMHDLFGADGIALHAWYPAFTDVGSGIAVENKRSASHDVKVAHLRPNWVKKEAFKPVPFLRAVMRMYKERYADHANLEVPIALGEGERSKLEGYLGGNAPTPA